MDHEQAVRSHTAERYLLNELTAGEVDEFEEHYFGCDACTDRVRRGHLLELHAKDAFRAEARKALAPSWAGWVWAQFRSSAPLAAAALLAITVYQSAVTIPGLRSEVAALSEPQAIPTGVALAVTRGDDASVVLQGQERFFHLVMDTTLPAGAAGSLCEIRAADGASVVATPVTLTGRGALDLLLPSSRFPTGRYTVTLRSGGASPRTEEFTFSVERKP